ncbi:MAG: 50S ribosomal protein L6 [Pseudomonadales bacterium]|nr:50S ribosomal protein L6 [Pseudomonadales bacterium]
MSRIAKSPVVIPAGIEVKQAEQEITIKGPKGSLSIVVNKLVKVDQVDGKIMFAPKKEAKEGWAQAGTARSLINNMIVGVTTGFEKKLQLLGVGYRAQVKGSVINLTLGFSHPVAYELPKGVTAESPSQTEIILRSADKQLLGQAAANVRAFRPPEPYKGKGVRYANEQVRRKEAKKK